MFTVQRDDAGKLRWRLCALDLVRKMTRMVRMMTRGVRMMTMTIIHDPCPRRKEGHSG